jgi:tetratricopeptide (TPR) repeat protein
MSEALAVRQGDPAVRERHFDPKNIEPLEPSAVREQLTRILASRAFARSPRISRFLGFVVEQTLDHQEDKLKEYLLGVEVFNRMDSFDPRIDSIVRVEARRLRYKLEKYYEIEGREDAVRIQFRKGCYVPLFSLKQADDPVTSNPFDFPHLDLIDNPHAFALYAKGRHHLGRWTADGIAESISCFTQALAEDPDCAGAHAGLATAWTLASLLGILPARDVMPKAKNSAIEALVSKPDCPEGQAILGIVSALYAFEWNEAEQCLLKAIASNPGDGEVRLWYGLWAMLTGRSEDALRELRKGQQAAPTCISAHLGMGFACHLAHAYDEALLQYRLAQDLSPSFYAPYLATGLLFTEQRMHEQAHQSLSHASQLSPRNPQVMAALAYSHAAAGRTDAARQLTSELMDLAGKQYVPPLTLSLANASIGEVERALQNLESAYEERSSWLALVRLLPAFAPIRDDGRYPALLARIGLA